MSEETLSMVTTLVFHYNLDAMDAKYILQKCSRVEYLDISEFLKSHEIARPGFSGEFLSFWERYFNGNIEFDK